MPTRKGEKMKRLRVLAISLFLLLMFTPFNLVDLVNQTDPINLMELVGQFNSVNLIDSVNQFDSINSINLINQTWAQPPEDYVIGRADVLEIFVWRNEQLSREVVVRTDGNISLPLLQDIQAEGLTVIQLRDEITRRFIEHLDHPRVTVIVSEMNSCKVSVLGRVTNPGVYPIDGDTKLVEAICMAGGFTEWANKRKITVITHLDGVEEEIIVNYKKIESGMPWNTSALIFEFSTALMFFLCFIGFIRSISSVG